ncbi:hypothetical protein J6590_099474, partial [Homalodisca vitripennis]
SENGRYTSCVDIVNEISGDENDQNTDNDTGSRRPTPKSQERQRSHNATTATVCCHLHNN